VERYFTVAPQTHGHPIFHVGSVGKVGDVGRAVDWAARALAVIGALEASIGSSGGYLIPALLAAEIIDLLREQTVVRKMTPLHRQVQVPQPNNVAIARIGGGASIGYIGEGVATDETQEQAGEITLSAKKARATVVVSNSLLRYQPETIDAFVLRDLMGQLAVLEDRAFLLGTGGQYSPTGLRTMAGTVVNATVSDYSVTTAIADLDAATKALRANKAPMRAPTWLMSGKSLDYLNNIVAAGSGNFQFRHELSQGKLGGFAYAWTQLIPDTLGGSSNQSEILLVDLDEVRIANFGIWIDASSAATYYDSNGVLQSGWDRDESVVRVIAEHDIGLAHSASAVVLTDVPFGNSNQPNEVNSNVLPDRERRSEPDRNNSRPRRTRQRWLVHLLPRFREAHSACRWPSAGPKSTRRTRRYSHAVGWQTSDGLRTGRPLRTPP
jgi:HK97 family phage major capsid protein